MTLLGAAKQQYVGIIRDSLSNILPVTMPDSNVTVEQFSNVLTQHVNRLGGKAVIHPLIDEAGFQVPNLDAEGLAFPASFTLTLSPLYQPKGSADAVYFLESTA